MIYFDNSATTKMDPTVLATYQQVAEEFMGNPSSLHHLGDQAQAILKASRQQIATLMGADSTEIIFTSGGTEGDNWVIKGTAFEKKDYGRHIITTAIEHPAVLNSVRQLEKLGWEVTILPVNAQGFVEPEQVKAALRPDTVLVSIMAVNNEIGSIQPIAAIGDLLEDYPQIHFHVDAVQSVGKNLASQIKVPRVDFMTFSAHKFHGPRGMGFVYAKRGRKLAPLLSGGGQENQRRSGTENVPAIAAMSRALRLTLADEKTKAKQEQKLKDQLLAALACHDHIRIFSPSSAQFAPHIVCFAIQGVRGETVVHALEERGIYISTTSACSSRAGVESSTLHAMHVPSSWATSAVRVSLDAQNTPEEMMQFITAIDDLYARFSRINHYQD